MPRFPAASECQCEGTACLGCTESRCQRCYPPEKCDFCAENVVGDNRIPDDTTVFLLGKGLIYYPELGYGSYNGVVVHMFCALTMQNYQVSEGVISFDD